MKSIKVFLSLVVLCAFVLMPTLSSNLKSFETQTVSAALKFKKPTKKTSKPKLPKKGFTSGYAAEKYLNDLLDGNGHKTFKTIEGKRVVDVYIEKTRWAHESKAGYASLTNTIKKQIDKDALLKKTRQVRGVKWHFFKSAKTGKIGASKPLIAYLNKKKIPYELHK